MKRSITVKEQELIDKLNNRYKIGVDTSSGKDQTVVSVVDRHVPLNINLVPEMDENNRCPYEYKDDAKDLEEMRANHFRRTDDEPVAAPSDIKSVSDILEMIAKKYNIPAKKYAWSKDDLVKLINEVLDTRLRTLNPEPEATTSTGKEQVNHPDHYNDYDVEVIEMMERVFGHEAVINFCRLNAFKYRMRAGHKDGNSLAQDLKKERWYLDYIKNHEK